MRIPLLFLLFLLVINGYGKKIDFALFVNGSIGNSWEVSTNKSIMIINNDTIFNYANSEVYEDYPSVLLTGGLNFQFHLSTLLKMLLEASLSYSYSKIFISDLYGTKYVDSTFIINKDDKYSYYAKVNYMKLSLNVLFKHILVQKNRFSAYFLSGFGFSYRFRFNEAIEVYYNNSYQTNYYLDLPQNNSIDIPIHTGIGFDVPFPLSSFIQIRYSLGTIPISNDFKDIYIGKRSYWLGFFYGIYINKNR